MGIPTKDALAGKHALKGTGQQRQEPAMPGSAASGPQEMRSKAQRNSGLMFNGAALEKGAQDSIAKADAAATAQRSVNSAGTAGEPFVVTRPKGRTVIVAKKDIVADISAERPVHQQENSAEPHQNGRAVAQYNPAHPSVLFHRLKQGLLSRLEITSFREKITRWLRRPTAQPDSLRRQARLARGDGTRLIQHRSGLILPAGEIDDNRFDLTQPRDVMGDLIAENQRLRLLVDEITRLDPAQLSKLRK